MNIIVKRKIGGKKCPRNQTKICNAMPVRIMLYDALSYDDQLRQIHINKKIRKNKNIKACIGCRYHEYDRKDQSSGKIGNGNL